MKERRVRCAQCGERFTVVRFARERTSAYCDWCREERRRTQTRARMHRFRARRGGPAFYAGHVPEADDDV